MQFECSQAHGNVTHGSSQGDEKYEEAGHPDSCRFIQIVASGHCSASYHDTALPPLMSQIQQIQGTTPSSLTVRYDYRRKRGTKSAWTG